MIIRILSKLFPVFRKKRKLKALIEGQRLSIGDYTYGLPEVYTYQGDSSTKLRIGRFTSIANEVSILLGGNHPTDRITLFPIRQRFDLGKDGSDGYPSSRGDVIIGDDVWIGFGVTILSGVSIGNGAVIGAGAVVTKDIAPFAVAVGNPARIIKFRFDEEIRERLLATKYWELDKERFIEIVDVLCSPLSQKTISQLESYIHETRR